MPAKSFWKGHLKLSLVTCPVAMTPATSENEKIRFHTLNRKTGNRVVSRNIDAVTNKAVAEKNEVKGYERGEDDFVILEDEELEAVALESARTIDIDVFAPRDSIDWIWLDKPHYLTPDDPVGEEAFCVIRDAMAAAAMVGLSRLVMYRRERAVMLEPRDKGIVLWTLRYGDEVRDEPAYFSSVENGKPDSKLMTLVKTLIDGRTRPWKPELARDPVQAKLHDIIESKKSGKKKPAKAPAAPASSGNVVNIMDALRKSVASAKSPKRA